MLNAISRNNPGKTGAFFVCDVNEAAAAPIEPLPWFGLIHRLFVVALG
jgi:hypothetical protein